MHPSAIVAARAGFFRTEVLQDDAGVVDLSELSHYRLRAAVQYEFFLRLSFRSAAVPLEESAVLPAEADSSPADAGSE